MTYAAVIVNVEARAPSDARVRLAAEVAGWFGAGLIGLAAEPLVAPPAHDAGLAYAATLDPGDRTGAALLATAERRFRAACPAGYAASAEWRSFAEPPAQALEREARSADLLVVGTDGEAEAGEVLMQAGRPVLVVPAETASLEARAVVDRIGGTPHRHAGRSPMRCRFCGERSMCWSSKSWAAGSSRPSRPGPGWRHVSACWRGTASPPDPRPGPCRRQRSPTRLSVPPRPAMRA